jgi:hypothetical protein
MQFNPNSCLGDRTSSLSPLALLLSHLFWQFNDKKKPLKKYKNY